MGDVDADAYVLRVSMNSEEMEGFAQVGDIARIYIDGREADQSPVTITDFGTTVSLDLTVGSAQEDEPDEETTAEDTTEPDVEEKSAAEKDSAEEDPEKGDE